VGRKRASVGREFGVKFGGYFCTCYRRERMGAKYYSSYLISKAEREGKERRRRRRRRRRQPKLGCHGMQPASK
jgi:hypothetical protein